MAHHFQYSCLENPMNSMKRQKDRTLKDELPRLVGTQYATVNQQRNNSRKNEEMESSSFSVISFCLFILFMGFSRQEY